jgi:hypothetical protein
MWPLQSITKENINFELFTILRLCNEFCHWKIWEDDHECVRIGTQCGIGLYVERSEENQKTFITLTITHVCLRNCTYKILIKSNCWSATVRINTNSHTVLKKYATLEDPIIFLILNQINSVQNLPPFFFRIHLNISLPYSPLSFKPFAQFIFL